MSTKKKPKKGKSETKKKLEFKLSKVEETFYQLTVADCEKKISNLKSHLKFLDENNVAIKEKIRSLHEDKVDPAAQMTSKVNAANEQIYEYNERIHELSQEYFEAKSKGDATISDLEEKYKAMHDQLTAEVKLLKGHLNMIDEFPKIEQKLNYIKELEEERRREKEQENTELIQATECRIKGEREALRKEIEIKMLHVSEEFTRSITFRNAAYTQRLIRENIALEKEIKVLESTYRSTNQLLKEQVERHKQVKASFPALKQKKKALIQVAQEKTSLIEQLTSKYESIKAAYVESLLYKTQYEDLVKYQLCGHFQRKELIKQSKNIGGKAHSLKTECVQMEVDYERNNQEIENLKSIIGLIRETVLKTIGVYDERLPKKKKGKKLEKLKTNTNEWDFENEEVDEEEAAAVAETSQNKDFYEIPIGDIAAMEEFQDDEDEEGMEPLPEIHERSLLETLFNILSFYKLHKLSTSSMETIPYDHLLQQHSELYGRSSDSLREHYKHDVSGRESSRVSDELAPAPQVFHTIPTERPERCPLFDIEKGSSLYIEISENNPEKISVEQQAEDQDVADESSSSFESLSEDTPVETPAADLQTTEKKESKSKFSLSEMPAGTILDVEMAEEGEEEDDENERTERDDEIYLADGDIEIAQDTDAIGDEEEEEMPIYMFY